MFFVYHRCPTFYRGCVLSRAARIAANHISHASYLTHLLDSVEVYHGGDPVPRLARSFARPRSTFLRAAGERAPRCIHNAGKCVRECAPRASAGARLSHAATCAEWPARRGSRIPDVYLWPKNYFIIIIWRYGVPVGRLFSLLPLSFLLSFPLPEDTGANERAYLHKDLSVFSPYRSLVPSRRHRYDSLARLPGNY